MWRAEPGDRLVAMWLARALACIGRHAEALEVLESVTATGRQLLSLHALRSILLIGAGRREEAQALARDTLEQMNKQRAPYSSSFSAVALFQLGDADAAFEILEHGMRTRSAYMPFVGEPLSDPLRREPRFVQLLERLGLPA